MVVERFHGNREKHWLFSAEDIEILHRSAISVSVSRIEPLNGNVLESSFQYAVIWRREWLLTAASTMAALLLMALPLGLGMKSLTGPIQPLWHYKPWIIQILYDDSGLQFSDTTLYLFILYYALPSAKLLPGHLCPSMSNVPGLFFWRNSTAWSTVRCESCLVIRLACRDTLLQGLLVPWFSFNLLPRCIIAHPLWSHIVLLNRHCDSLVAPAFMVVL